MSQDVPHKVDFAALPGCSREAMLYCRNKPFVRIAGNQLWCRKATVHQAMEDALIGFQRFFRHRLNGKDITLSVFIYTTDDDDRFTLTADSVRIAPLQLDGQSEDFAT